MPVDNAGKLPLDTSMKLKEQLLNAAQKYCDRSGMSKARLATIVVNDGKFFVRLEGGGGCTIETYERVIAYLDKHMPPKPSEPATEPSEAA